MSISHVRGQLQPALGLILNVRTTCVTTVVRVLHLTTIIQETYTCIVVQLTGRTADVSVVLLTEAAVEQLIIPVISDIGIIIIRVTHCCIGVQFEVCTNELLTIGYVINLYTKTTIVRIKDVLVSISISLLSCSTMIILAIEHSTIVSLIVLSRILDDVVLRNQTAVRTPFCIELDDGILIVLSLLGGDDDHTVSTTVTVDGTCRGVLQH